MTTTFTTLLIMTITSILAYAHDEHSKCAHNKYNHVPGLLDVEEEFLSNQTRFLATASYPNIRITADYDLLNSEDQAFQDYVKNQLFPPVVDYFEAALALKQALTSPLKLSSTTKTICGYTTPKNLLAGINTDFHVIVSSDEDTDNWVASAGACYLSTITKRPLIALMTFNVLYTKSTADVLVHEKNMYLTMHEMMHAFGFTLSSFSNFIDANGKTLTGHIKTVYLNGSNRTVLDVEPLTSKARAFFGCSNLEGVYMENDGGAGTAGSHLERRHFTYETMTSGVIHGRRISEFSLGVLEASGWYLPNYTYAEPFYFGQGEGCNFLYKDCTASTFSSYSFDEFCAGSSSRGCTAVGRGGGVCSNDSRSDGCKFYIPVADYDCESETASENARFPDLETYGRGLGSKCFSGNLTKQTKSSQTSMCFKYTCVGSGLSTTLQVTLGSTKITCKTQGSLKVSGYNGNLDCPDPLTFCSTVGKKFCPRNCMGRGTCVNNICQCNSGFGGVDCALKL